MHFPIAGWASWFILLLIIQWSAVAAYVFTVASTKLSVLGMKSIQQMFLNDEQEDAGTSEMDPENQEGKSADQHREQGIGGEESRAPSRRQRVWGLTRCRDGAGGGRLQQGRAL